MGERIDQFCEDLRQKLTMADSGLEGLKAKISGKAAHVEQDVQSHLDRVHKRVEQGRSKIAAAQADIKEWADQKKTATGASKKPAATAVIRPTSSVLIQGVLKRGWTVANTRGSSSAT